MINGWLVFLILLNAWILGVYLAARWGYLQRWNIGLLGPALMIRTQHGKNVIERISRTARFWIVTGTGGIWLTLLMMFALTALLIWQVPTLFEIPEDQAPGAREILAIPGINPLIPIGYGIFALILAIVIHEFAHGVLARAQKMRVKSLGMLLLIVPIGAFVEPDEEELLKRPRKQRMRVYAAGPTSNLVTALICGLIFSAGFVAAAEPVGEGVGVVEVVDGSPAARAGFEQGWLITAINGTTTPDYQGFLTALRETEPGQQVVVATAGHGEHTVCLGHFSQFEPGDDPPGEEHDFCAHDRSEFEDAHMNATAARLGVEPDELDRDEELANMTGFLGVQSLPFAPARLQQMLAHPFQNLQSFVFYVAMPFTGLTPLKEPITLFFDVPWDGIALGPLVIGQEATELTYWIIANMFYWLMWISLMLGLTNALPAVPLDGGYLFRDFVDGVVHRFRPNSTEADRQPFVKKTSVYVSFMILGLIVLQFVAPRLAGLMS